MRIAEFHAENVKKLKVVDITPDAHMQVLSGPNESGKSSILDAIWWALAGKKPIQARPIRDGEESAVVRLDLGELIVKRTFKRHEDGGYKTDLLVLNPVGAEPGTPDNKLPKWGSPQDMLDALLGELTFDPLAFSRMKPAEQLEELRRIVKLPIDIDELDRENAADYAARTDLNREAKQKRTQAEAIRVPEGTPPAPLNESELLDRIQEAGKFNADIERRRSNRTRVQEEIVTLRQHVQNDLDRIPVVQDKATERIAELHRQIRWIEEETHAEVSGLKSGAMTASTRADELQAKVDGASALPVPVSIEELRASLDLAKETNAAVANRERKAALAKEAEALEANAACLTSGIEFRDNRKVQAIRSAQMPVEHIGFGIDHVTYKGLPLDQASSGMQLRISIAIAMAANPKLRVLRIKDGGLLDARGMELVAEMAREHDFQVWMETCSPVGFGIVMEEGEVKK